MKKKLLKTLLLILLLLLAIVLGMVIGNVCEGVSWLRWLSLSSSFGLKPTSVDLSVLQLTFGLTVKVNVAQAIFLVAAILLYSRIRIKD